MDPFAAGAQYAQQQQPASDGMSWWFKYLIKGAAVVLGCIAFILGIVTAISISPLCIIAGIILMLVKILQVYIDGLVKAPRSRTFQDFFFIF